MPPATFVNAILEHCGPPHSGAGDWAIRLWRRIFHRQISVTFRTPLCRRCSCQSTVRRIPKHGHLPVTIPGIASRGAVGNRPAPTNSGGSSSCSARNFVRPLTPAAASLRSLFCRAAVLCERQGQERRRRVDIKTPMGDIHVMNSPTFARPDFLSTRAKPAPKIVERTRRVQRQYFRDGDSTLRGGRRVQSTASRQNNLLLHKELHATASD